MLKIYDTLVRDKREFIPLTPGAVRMYVCGMTVYDYCHLGHARVMVVFDVVRRWLRASGFSVTYVRNITDIDDKIIRRAQENGEPMEALTARFIRAMDEDAAALGIEKPDFEPRATQYVQGMLDMIGVLRDRGLAYEAGNGDVNYSVRKFPDYGKLSGKSLEDLRAGERVEVDRSKQDPLDFVLWKRAKEGEPAWDSPWGKGRPGWHIECSAMSGALLGKHFDIHGGGQDLQFPHHENEIAQSEGAHQHAFVNYWMHNGFVRVDNEKMSKSLGNFFTVRDVLPRLRPEVLRAFLLSSQYRAPVNYTDDNLRQADAALQRLYLALRDVEPAAEAVPGEATRAFAEAMDDDYNTPGAIAALQDAARELNVAKAAGVRPRAAALAAELRRLGGLLGLLGQPASAWLAAPSTLAAGAAAGNGTLDAGEIERRIEARIEARRARNWAESDRIRDELAAAGVLLEDGPSGTTWRRK
jgi:cysteinyl-tRNA synthetase